VSTNRCIDRSAYHFVLVVPMWDSRLLRQLLGQAKVNKVNQGELILAIFSDHHVGRFQVTMYVAELVTRL